MRSYVVRQGDYIARIANRYGVTADDIWNHPRNESIRERRGDPNILRQGDVLIIPDGPQPSADLRKGETHRFVTHAQQTEIQVGLRNADGAVSGAAFRVEGLPGREIEGTTDGDGVATFEVPVGAEHVSLVVEEPSLRFKLDIGHLDPADDSEGVRARLVHLGYLGSHGGDEEVENAVAQFQRDQGTEPTGQLDEETATALTDEHGS